MPLLAADFEADVRPFLVEHCVACHGQTVQVANLRFDGLTNEKQALAKPEIWEDVLRMVAARKMPPSGSVRPSEEAYRNVEAWIESRLDEIVANRKPDPGRVTARRLNRTEYNNTVRDLLYVDLRPADEFPVDDSGYGFDNNADVLSVSPVLVEKYVQAAGRLARAAIWDQPRLAKPTRFRIEGSRQAKGEAEVAAIGEVAPFTEDGSIELTYEFPAAGEYRIKFGASDRRLRSPETGQYMEDAPIPPPRLMTLMAGDRRIATKAVEAENGFVRSESLTRRIEAGKWDIWLGFIDAQGKPMNPNSEYNERRLWVDYLEISGPYDADARPLPESHRRIMVCTPAAEEPWRPCAERIVRKLLPRAYRRPASDVELLRLLTIVERSMRDGLGFERGIQLAVQAVLVSPDFLFRIEGDPVADGLREINDFELASRMSYFLWSSMPDEQLFNAAASGRLSDPAERRGQVRRMLDDPKSTAFIENFAGQWLQLRNLAGAQPDAERFPEFDDGLRSAMKRETELFFEAIVREDRDVLELIDSDFTYLNARLAAHYGIDGVVGDEFRKVELADARRGGLLSHASVLTVSSYPTRTSPVLRGLWVLENLLGQPPPPPPPDVPELEVAEGPAGGTLREQMEKHRADASCAACHQVMDTIGFGLENYDAVGKWRSSDGGSPLDSSGALPGGMEFGSPGELKRILRQAEGDAVTRTLTKKLMTYALGRGLSRADNPAVDEVQSTLTGEGNRFSVLITGIVESLPFRMRRGDGVAAGE